MFKINKKIEYALMALKFMAQKEESSAHELTTAREVCDHFGTPFDTTAKVMQTMNQSGLLSSVKGIKGGYSLAKPLSSVSYMDLARMIEGRESEHYCSGHKGPCELIDNCNIAAPVDLLNKKIHRFLEDVNLHELLFLNNEEKTILKMAQLSAARNDKALAHEK